MNRVKWLACVAAASFMAACAGSSPTDPTPRATAPSSNISVASITVTPEAVGTGHTYRAVVKLRESGGVAATITAIDLTFMSGSSALASSHAERPISETANLCPANASVDSRELMTADTDPSHPVATSVVAKITFTDGATTGNTSGTASVPPLSSTPATVFTLSGIVSDESTQRAIAGATVQIVDGASAGKTTSTSGDGAYSLSGVSGSFTLRTAASGYESSDGPVTVDRDTRLDLRLRPAVPPSPSPTPPPAPPAPCAYTISPTANTTDWKGGTFSATVTRTSGNCAWQASSDANWITIADASGNGNATISYTVTANAFDSRTRFGGVTISWSGGSARLSVQQAGASMLCEFTVSTGSQDITHVPSAGAQIAATINWVDTGRPPGTCSLTLSAFPSWISVPTTSLPQAATSLTITVAPNPSPGSSRTGTVNLIGSDRTATILLTQQ